MKRASYTRSGPKLGSLWRGQSELALGGRSSPILFAFVALALCALCCVCVALRALLVFGACCSVLRSRRMHLAPRLLAPQHHNSESFASACFSCLRDPRTPHMIHDVR
eukprot:scaffold32690_cov107-Isochrysis_galbana.AAC.9